MRSAIRRTLTVSKIYGYSVTVGEDGKTTLKELDPLHVFGVVSERVAQRHLTRSYAGKKGVAVSRIETSKNTYEITTEDFIKYAKKL